MRIVIAGGSGFIGTPFSHHLHSKGHEVLRLTRDRPRVAGDIQWDPAAGTLDAQALEGCDVVVNMVGENLGDRWSPAKKKAFRESRMQSTGLLARSIRSLQIKPKLLVSASAIGIYGAARGDELLDEESSHGSDFLATLCEEWEAAAQPVVEAGVRLVICRTGPVLHPEGGMLAKLLTPFRMGVGGKVGDGNQWLSWISRTDLNAALLFAIENERLSGPVNFTTPNPVTNEELAQTLGRVLHRPAVAPVPAAVVRLMFGREMADLTVLASQRVLPRKLTGAGFTFAFPELESALRHELR
jgi:uncharacterized protein (TIGR01777 family)